MNQSHPKKFQIEDARQVCISKQWPLSLAGEIARPTSEIHHLYKQWTIFVNSLSVRYDESLFVPLYMPGGDPNPMDESLIL